MSPKRFPMAAVELFSVSEQTHCAQAVCDSESVTVDSVSLYGHINHEAYQGRGAQDGYLDFHTAPEL